MTRDEFKYLSAGDWLLGPGGRVAMVGSCDCIGIDTEAVYFMGGGSLVIGDCAEWEFVGRVAPQVRPTI